MNTLENLIKLFLLKNAAYSYHLHEAANELHGMVVKKIGDELKDYGITPANFLAICFWLKNELSWSVWMRKASQIDELLYSFYDGEAKFDLINYEEVKGIYQELNLLYENFCKELQSSTPYTNQEKFFAHSTNCELVQIMHNLPENAPLYKDSGLWQVRTDDMQEVIAQQTANESFEDFIRRYSDAVSIAHEQIKSEAAMEKIEIAEFMYEKVLDKIKDANALITGINHFEELINLYQDSATKILAERQCNGLIYTELQDIIDTAKVKEQAIQACKAKIKELKLKLYHL